MREESSTNREHVTGRIRRFILAMMIAVLALGGAVAIHAAPEDGQKAANGPVLDASGHLHFMKDGAIDAAYDGFLKYEGTWYYLKGGTSEHDILGFVKNPDNGGWFFVQDGKVNWKFTGIAQSTYNQKWYFARKGKLDWGFTGVAKSIKNGKWYFCRKGAVDWKFTGIAKSVKDGKWYFCRKGKLDWGFTGLAKSVENGKWYFCRKGRLDWGYTGLAKSVKNGKWYYVKKGRLDWKYNGKAKYKGKTYNVSGGAVTGSTKSGGGKVVYLTFDDGPGQHTDRLLKILAKYDAKATFFVTGQFPKYSGCIKRAAAAGHAIGAHTMTHDFKKIYSSDSAFWSDQDKVQNLIKKQTGSRTKLLRFAGGSSNTISRKYNRGIMSRLAKQCGQKGVVYFDWNVLSGDAGETTSSSVVAQNVINGIKKQKQPVVLCHDIKGFTVSAMEQVLSWGTKNGYTFRGLTTSSPAPHHSILN